MKASVRMLGTAAAAVTMSLGVAAPAALADDGHDDGRAGFSDHRGDHDGWRSDDHDGWRGDDDGDRDGDHDGWGWSGRDWRAGHHHGWRHHHRHGWSGHDRDGSWQSRFSDDKADDDGDKTVSAPSEQGSFADHQAAVLSALGRADACLAVLADRVDDRAAAIDAYRAKIADLIAQARAATSDDELRAIFAQHAG